MQIIKGNLSLWKLLLFLLWIVTLAAVDAENRRASGRQKQQAGPRNSNRQISPSRRCEFRGQCRRRPSQTNRMSPLKNKPAENNPNSDTVTGCTNPPCNKEQYGYIGPNRGPVSTGAVNSRQNTFGLANGFIAPPHFFVRRFRPVAQPQMPSTTGQPVTDPVTETADPAIPSTPEDIESTTVDIITLRKQLFGWD